VNLTPVAGGEQPAAQADVTADGRFTIEGCLPGRHTVDVSQLGGRGSWTVASITSNGRDLLTQPLELDGDVSDLAITFTDQPTQISGAVQTGGRLDEPVQVIVFPADYTAAADAGMLIRRSRLVAVDSGRFVIDGLPAGRYLVAAISLSEATSWMTRDVIRAIASRASTVSLSDRSHVTVDVKPVVIR
jgi:hypothetical protein